MKFALVVIETDASRRHVREHRDDHRARLQAWMAEQAQAGKLLGGEAFETEAIEPVTVRRNDAGEPTVVEGPFVGGNETLGGYLLIEAADRAAAVEIAKSWPTEETIEIRPIWAPA